MAEKAEILAGRKAVKAYRTAHIKLYEKGRRKGIPEEHTPSLNIMVKALKGLGFNTIQEFFKANKELKIQTFKECYKIEGYCSHDCHGRVGGCPEGWYQNRIALTEGETLEPVLSDKEGLIAFDFWNEQTNFCPPRCSYRIVKVKEPDIDWRWR